MGNNYYNSQNRTTGTIWNNQNRKQPQIQNQYENCITTHSRENNQRQQYNNNNNNNWNRETNCNDLTTRGHSINKAEVGPRGHSTQRRPVPRFSFSQNQQRSLTQQNSRQNSQFHSRQNFQNQNRCSGNFSPISVVLA
ncbi:putative uncharacterized protein DDB_G0286829 [Macrobrachium rosenbergii]|uniref:putative uncharacterized protein DDB_G0286829 n=1 Tax=Macrobrachium rosenbergii TaxID=79674 RepID=UPI0034D4F6D6